jgi:hypothetical protein
MGQERSVAMRNMQGLSQNGEAIEGGPQICSNPLIWTSVLPQSKVRRCPKSPLFNSNPTDCGIFHSRQNTDFLSKSERIGRAIRCVLAHRESVELIQTPADEKRRSRLETMAAAEYDSPDDDPPSER